LTSIPKVEVGPVMVRRNNMIQKLETQKLLLENPKHVKVTKNRAGETKQHRVRQMWREAPDGSCVFFVRGIEFAKGKSGILAKNKKELPGIIETL
jgi:hypothetical protein